MQVRLILPIYPTIPNSAFTIITIPQHRIGSELCIVHSPVSALVSEKKQSESSLFYILSNVISATEQLNLCYVYATPIGQTARSEVYFKNSRDWMHLFQVTTVWMLLSCLLFLTGLYCASGSFFQKARVLIASLLPVLAVLVPLIRGRPRRNIWGGKFFSTLRILLFTNPAVTFLVGHGLSGHKVLKIQDFTSTVSIAGFASQTTVHIILAIYFFSLVRIPFDEFVIWSWAGMRFWYDLLGWFLIDHAIFVAVQGRLLWIALKERMKIAQKKTLLGS